MHKRKFVISCRFNAEFVDEILIFGHKTRTFSSSSCLPSRRCRKKRGHNILFYIFFLFSKLSCDTKTKFFLKFLLLLTQIFILLKIKETLFDFTTLISINDSLMQINRRK